MKVSIRNAIPEDAETLARIAYAAKASWGYSEDLLEAWRADLTPTVDSLRDRMTLVAEEDDRIAGFCQIAIEDGSAELLHFWIDPPFMRRGVGRALLAHSIRLLAGRGVRMLEIDADPNAEPFYVACGATRTRRVPAPIAGDAARERPQLRIAIAASEYRRSDSAKR
jgi:GNAT superfamily N-acetyltransferase